MLQHHEHVCRTAPFCACCSWQQWHADLSTCFARCSHAQVTTRWWCLSRKHCTLALCDAGAGVISLVWPGTGTALGYNAADLAITLFVIGPLADQYFGSYPPPSGPPPAALDAGALAGDSGTLLANADEQALRGNSSINNLCLQLFHDASEQGSQVPGCSIWLLAHAVAQALQGNGSSKNLCGFGHIFSEEQIITCA